MVHRFPIAFFAVAAALLLGGRAPAWEALSQQEFLAQYGAAAERLHAVYGHMTLEATVTRSAMDGRKPFVPRQTLVAHTDGDKLRVEGIVPDGAGGHEERVAVTSPDKTFIVRREPGQEAFALSSLSSVKIPLRSRHHYMFAPFCENGGVHLIDKFRAKNIRITSVDELERNGEVLVKVAYERDIGYGNKASTYSGYDVFSKTLGWALRESVAGDDVQQRGVVEYDGTFDGVPLLKSAEYWKQVGDERVNIVRCEVTRIDPESPPAEMFELATVLGIARREKPSSSWPWWIAGGIALIALVSALAWLALHRRAAA